MASEYTLGEKLGEGAFGTVYKATRTCALKSIDISSVQDEEKAARKAEWKQEVEALMRVRGHENIVEYRNSFASFDDKLWVEMEYCNGGTLNDYVIEKNPGKDIKHRFMVEISAGVAFLHAQDVVHRDLKPENIMVCIDDDEQPHVKVGDFGLAKMLACCNFEGQLMQYYLCSGCGTEYFVAPEVYDGHYTEKADIFSMGIIFYAMVPKPGWVTIGNKKCLLVRCSPGFGGRPNATPLGKYMHETGCNLLYTVVYDGKMSPNALKLLDSMIVRRYDQRPSAEQINTTLKSISPKELSMLAPPPVAPPPAAPP